MQCPRHVPAWRRQPQLAADSQSLHWSAAKLCEPASLKRLSCLVLQHQHQHDGVQELGCTWSLVTGMSRPEADDLWSSLMLHFVSSPQPNSAQG